MTDLSLALAAGRVARFEWALDGTALFSNEWKAQLGLAPDAVFSTLSDFTARLHPDDAQYFDERWRSLSEAGPFECEYRLMHRTSEYRWYRATIERSSEHRLCAAQVDVHALKTAESRLLTLNVELARAVSAREDFLASMSHELRTPLNSVLGQAQAMTEGTFGTVTPPMREALDVISASGRHLLSLLNTVLDLARLEAGAMSLTREQVGLVAVCQEALHVARPEAVARKTRLEFVTQCHPDDVAWLDRLRVRQILVNLLSNATKFSPPDEVVRLELRPDDEAWAFVVSDRGPGIDPLDQRRLFHPFVQAEPRGKRKDGAGLGLALVKRLVDLHGGSIELESALGHGSRFTVRLPIAPDTLPLASSPAPVVGALSSAMIVDDTIINIEPLRRYLVRLGVEVRTAESGPQALQLIAERAPQVVFLDWHMPGMDGLEVIRRLRDAPFSRNVKIIVLTALVGDHVRNEALITGADAFIAKPARLAEAAALANSLVPK